EHAGRGIRAHRGKHRDRASEDGDVEHPADEHESAHGPDHQAENHRDPARRCIVRDGHVPLTQNRGEGVSTTRWTSPSTLADQTLYFNISNKGTKREGQGPEAAPFSIAKTDSYVVELLSEHPRHAVVLEVELALAAPGLREDRGDDLPPLETHHHAT